MPVRHAQAVHVFQCPAELLGQLPAAERRRCAPPLRQREINGLAQVGSASGAFTFLIAAAMNFFQS
jgi:hypothetical protein